MSEVSETVAALGGESALGCDVRTVVDVHRLMGAGLPSRSMERFARHYEFTTEDMAVLLGLKIRSVQRRQKGERLTPAESDRLWRSAQVMTTAERLLGSREKARQWFERPNRALGGYPPYEFLRTEAGYTEVVDVLGRLAHGVWS